MDEIREKIRIYFSRFFRNSHLQDDTDIFASGFVNSLMAMQLVMFVEKEFDISIENEDLDIDNFKSIDAITRLIGRRSKSEATGKPQPSGITAHENRIDSPTRN